MRRESYAFGHIPRRVSSLPSFAKGRSPRRSASRSVGSPPAKSSGAWSGSTNAPCSSNRERFASRPCTCAGCTSDGARLGPLADRCRLTYSIDSKHASSTQVSLLRRSAGAMLIRKQVSSALASRRALRNHSKTREHSSMEHVWDCLLLSFGLARRPAKLRLSISNTAEGHPTRISATARNVIIAPSDAAWGRSH